MVHGVVASMDRRYSDFEDDMLSEAAVERWLTSPASATTSQYGNSKNASPTTSVSGFGGSRHSHAGVFTASDVDSATRSMTMAAANALAGAHTTVASPGGQNIKTAASTSPAGRAILRQRLRQRVKKNGGGSGAQVFQRPYAVETERHPSSQAGASTISASSSVTPQHRLESLLQDKGLMLQESHNKQREPTAPSISSPTNSDFLKAFLAIADLDGASPLSDSALRTRLEALAVSRVRSANATLSSKTSYQRRNGIPSDRDTEEEMLLREIAVLALSANSGLKDTSTQSSLISRRKSSNAAPALGSLSAPSSPRRRSSFRRQSSNPMAVHPLENDNAARDGGNDQGHVVVSTSGRGENRIFFARSSGDTPGSRSTKSGDIIPLRRQRYDEDDDEPAGPKVTPSTSQRNFSSLREVKTFSPRGSANLPASKPKNRQATQTTVSSMVVEAREQSEGFHQKLRREVKHDPRQGFVPPSRTNRIRLHVYDLIAQETVVQLPWGCHFPIGQCFSVVNSSLHELGTGAYHVGVEVNGIEYAYGSNETRNTTGVFTCMPKHSPGYQYRTTIDFGERTLVRTAYVSADGSELRYKLPQDATPKGSDKVPEGFRVVDRQMDGREVLREMAREYMGTDYDLLRKNCCTFAHDAAIRLGVRDSEVPTWFLNLCYAGALTQDAAVSTMEPLSKVFSSCDCDINDEVPEYLENLGFEVISNEQIAATKGRSSKNGVVQDSDARLSADSKFRRTSSWQY